MVRRPFRFLWAGSLSVVAALTIASCSDEGPTRPSGGVPDPRPGPTAASSAYAAGTSLQIVSGADEAPVSGAKVTVGSTVLTTDGDGRVTLPQGFDVGAYVDVDAPDFLYRQTLLRARSPVSSRFSLWPKTSLSGLTEDFTSEVAYHPSTGTTRGMMRIAPGAEAYVVPTSQILEDVRAREVVEDAVSELNAIARGEIRFVVVSDDEVGSDSAAVRFDLVIDPNDEALDGQTVGVARRRFSGWTIVGGTVVFRSMEIARTSTTLHELGHMYGLGHSASRADIMYPYLRRRVEDFSPRERLLMDLMLERPASNVHPDNDRHVSRDLSLSAVPAPPSTVLCYF